MIEHPLFASHDQNASPPLAGGDKGEGVEREEEIQ
jgi:hypothetical protein